MKKIIRMLAASVIFGLAASPFMPSAANATPAPFVPSFETCDNLKGKWYVNGDETSRKPTATVEGLKFQGNQLIHHGATGTLENMGHGTFTLAAGSDEPDQPSFFSVEVRNGDGSGYATLRWNTDTDKWNMVTGGQFYENTSASALVLMATPPKSSNLLSFGVGYTNSPPGTNTAVVSKVTFRGVDYPLTCAPPVQPSPSASSASPSPSGSASTTPVTQPTLPVTGTRPYFIAATGAIAVFLGIAIIVAFRKKKEQ